VSFSGKAAITASTLIANLENHPLFLVTVKSMSFSPVRFAVISMFQNLAHNRLI
jgi:hypothetical protein